MLKSQRIVSERHKKLNIPSLVCLMFPNTNSIVPWLLRTYIFRPKKYFQKILQRYFGLSQIICLSAEKTSEGPLSTTRVVIKLQYFLVSRKLIEGIEQFLKIPKTLACCFCHFGRQCCILREMACTSLNIHVFAKMLTLEQKQKKFATFAQIFNKLHKNKILATMSSSKFLCYFIW